MTLVAHADWSMHAAKRWMTVASPQGCGWRLAGESVGPLPTLLLRLHDRANGNAVALGIDAPMGLPLAYRRPFETFPAFLASLQTDDPFFEVCDAPEEISLDRPFYPRRSLKGSRRREQHERLALSGAELVRECERALGGQREASSLFWTLGAKQAGKGAICLWREVIAPALRSPAPPALWPFDGPLAASLAAGRTVLAESYPASAMRQMQLGFRGSKRRQADRQAVARRLRDIADDLGAVADAPLAAEIDDGFGAGAEGEDRFDSLLGLLRMLQIIRNPALDQLPDPAIRRWEGWILGRPLSNA